MQKNIYSEQGVCDVNQNCIEIIEKRTGERNKGLDIVTKNLLEKFPSWSLEPPLKEQ